MADSGENVVLRTDGVPRTVIRGESSGRISTESLVAEIARAMAAPSQADAALQFANLWFGLSDLPEGQRIAWQADLADRLTVIGADVLQQTLDDRATRLRLVLIGDDFTSTDIAHALTLRSDIAALAGCALAALGTRLLADVADCDRELERIAGAPGTRRCYRRAVSAIRSRSRTRRNVQIEALGLSHLYPQV